MNAWKKCDKFLSVFCWIVIGLQIVYALARLIIPIDWAIGIDWYVSWIMPVLLAGAVGYVTNWLALWYLFKPYEPHCGGRIQGIIPRQKKSMAVSMGRMVGEKLLNPDALVDELKNEVRGFVDDPAKMTRLRETVQRYLIAHSDEIADFVTPYAERQIVDVFDSLATDDTWGNIWNEWILPRLKNAQARKFLIEKFVAAIQEKSDGMIDEIRTELRAFLTFKLSQHVLFKPFAASISDYVMDNIATAESMKEKFCNWLSRESSQELLRQKVMEYADQITTWMKNGDGRMVMSGVVRELKVRGRRFLSTYIREKIPVLIERVFASATLQEKIDRVVLPRVGEKLIVLISENKQLILDKLRLQDRVSAAVDGMSVRDFHMTLNEFMAENFCAVQVLGFAFGAIVGALQLFSKI